MLFLVILNYLTFGLRCSADNLFTLKHNWCVFNLHRLQVCALSSKYIKDCIVQLCEFTPSCTGLFRVTDFFIVPRRMFAQITSLRVFMLLTFAPTPFSCLKMLSHASCFAFFVTVEENGAKTTDLLSLTSCANSNFWDFDNMLKRQGKNRRGLRNKFSALS